MGTISIDAAIKIGAYLVAIGVFGGVLKTSLSSIKEQIKRLETKQDKHNSLIERMVAVESSTKSAHHRLDDICGKTS